jgi:hypothetical protein
MSKICYENRLTFLAEVKKWCELDSVRTVTWLAKELKVTKSTVSLWWKPFSFDRPNISFDSIVKLERLSGINYIPGNSYEEDDLNEARSK